MAKYYFTYGLGQNNNQDYVGGWTEVEAENAGDAIDVYQIYHPNRDGLMPCCSVALSEKRMGDMLQDGNGGKFCHDRITLKREVFS